MHNMEHIYSQMLPKQRLKYVFHVFSHPLLWMEYINLCFLCPAEWRQIFYLESIEQACSPSISSKPIHNIFFPTWIIFDLLEVKQNVKCFERMIKQTILVNESDLVIYFRIRFYIQIISRSAVESCMKIAACREKIKKKKEATNTFGKVDHCRWCIWEHQWQLCDSFPQFFKF